MSLDGGQAKSQRVASPSQWIEAPSALAPRVAVSGSWADGSRGVGFWLGGSSPVTPIVAHCPAETGSRKVPLLIGRQKGKGAVFFTVLFPYQNKFSLSVERHGDQFGIQHGGFSDRLKVPAGTRPSIVHNLR